MSREVRELPDARGRELTIYCCGPTVYGPAHIGNFRTFIMQDVFRRTVEATGQKVRHVRNITDVDDKTIRQSRSEGVSLADFTKKWTEKFHSDCEALNLLRPAVEPSAVAHIPEQIALIGRLVEKGHAYVAADGSVYYRVGSFSPYGALSRLKERQITTVSNRPVDDSPEREMADEYARDSAADFALWKAAKPEDGDNFWQSPWGAGRPGWHIECSAMAMKHLGETLDMHSGGIDLLFPHHENEIAQSEAVTGKTFVRHWFHVHHLMVDSQKMSKSLGNLYTLDDVLARGHTAAELRYCLLSGHYRQPLNFTWDSLHAARSALRRLANFYTTLCGEVEMSRALQPGQPEEQEFTKGPFAGFWREMFEDLNTPGALGELFGRCSEILPHAANGNYPPEEVALVRKAFERVIFALGLDLSAPKSAVPAEVRELAEQRYLAKQGKDFATADALREKLSELGWQVKDRRDGYELERAVR